MTSPAPPPTKSRNVAAWRATWRSSKWPPRPPTPGSHSTRSTASHRAPTTAHARWEWPSPDAHCPAPTSRCSPCRPDRMAVGMGVHGEPGTSETDVPSADDLAELLVTKLLRDLPADIDDRTRRPRRAHPQRAGHRQTRRAVRGVPTDRPTTDEQGVIIVQPEVGEFVTSYDMAGVSLTLFWLDDELETYWNAPAHSAAYRKGALTVARHRRHRRGRSRRRPAEWVEQPVTADEASRAAAHASSMC